MRVRVESSLLGTPEYLSFDFINISYLLYFSESALLSTFIIFPSLSVRLASGSKFSLSLGLVLFLAYRDLILRVFSDYRAQVSSLG